MSFKNNVIKRMFQKTIKLVTYNEISISQTFHNKTDIFIGRNWLLVSFETTFSKADKNETFLNLPKNKNRTYESPHTRMYSLTALSSSLQCAPFSG